MTTKSKHTKHRRENLKTRKYEMHFVRWKKQMEAKIRTAKVTEAKKD